MVQWSTDDLKAASREKGWLVASREIEHAIQFVLTEGVQVNLYKEYDRIGGTPLGWRGRA